MRRGSRFPAPRARSFDCERLPWPRRALARWRSRSRAAGTNRGELIRGAALKAGSAPRDPRAGGYGIRGEIAAVGDGVSAWQPGDRVMGRAVGSYAKSVSPISERS